MAQQAPALALGADRAVNGRTQDPVARVREPAGGRGVDVAFEAIGNPATFRQATEMLAYGGRLVAVGIAAGNAAAEVEITPLVRRGRHLVGSFGARTREDLPQVVEAAASGAIDLAGSISHTYTLEQINYAFDALRRGAITGRAVIAFDER